MKILLSLLMCSTALACAVERPTTNEGFMVNEPDAGHTATSHDAGHVTHVEEDAGSDPECTNTSQCIDITNLVTPRPGEDGLLSYHYENTCDETITMRQCTEEIDGTCNCSWYHQMAPGASSTFYTVHSAGRFSWTAIRATDPTSCIKECPCPGGCH